MATSAAVGARRVPGRITRVCAAVQRGTAAAARKAVAPHRVALSNLGGIPLTCAGSAGIDFAAWHIGHGWGWLATGVSLIILEHLIADET